MATIITGRFQRQEEAQQAISNLIREGLVASQTAVFFVNPPGQHDLYPIGGDRDDSPGAEDSGEGSVAGAAAGGAAGVAVGLMTLPIIGPAAAAAATGVGDYVGSLYGALGTTDHSTTPETPGLTARRTTETSVASQVGHARRRRSAVPGRAGQCNPNTPRA